MANLNSIPDLSNTASSNINYKGQSIRGTALASTIDSMFQNNASMLADFYDSLGGVATVSGTDTYTVTITEDWAALASGLFLAVKIPNANTGAATLNVTVPTAGALGAKAIRRQGDSALQANDMVANGIYLLRYSSTYNTTGAWVLLNGGFQAADADLTALATTGVGAFSGLLWGVTLSNNGSDATNDIDIAAGIAIDSTNAKFINLAAGITKQLDASWAVGTNAGGLDTGSIANTTYHVWLIMRSDTGVVDVLFSASASAPTMPTNYDYKRRIGSIVRTSNAIKAFTQTGDTFEWSTPVVDVDATNPGTSAVTRTLTVPIGIRVEAILTVAGAPLTSNFGTYISDLSQTDLAAQDVETASLTNMATMMGGVRGTGLWFAATARVFTNTSGQVRSRISVSGASNHLGIITHGWVDTRGRVA